MLSSRCVSRAVVMCSTRRHAKYQVQASPPDVVLVGKPAIRTARYHLVSGGERARLLRRRNTMRSSLPGRSPLSNRVTDATPQKLTSGACSSSWPKGVDTPFAEPSEFSREKGRGPTARRAGHCPPERILRKPLHVPEIVQTAQNPCLCLLGFCFFLWQYSVSGRSCSEVAITADRRHTFTFYIYPRWRPSSWIPFPVFALLLARATFIKPFSVHWLQRRSMSR